jgi:peroxiredoxin
LRITLNPFFKSSRVRHRALKSIMLASLAGGTYLISPMALHYIAMAIAEQRELKPLQRPPDFVLADANGKHLRLSRYKGQVVLLNFWATWCLPCKTEIPWFIDFEKRFQKQGFTVIGVSMDEDGWSAINPYIVGQRINYPVVLATEEMNEIYGGIDVLPTTLLIGRDGKVVFIHKGLIRSEEYEKEIRELL